MTKLLERLVNQALDPLLHRIRLAVVNADGEVGGLVCKALADIRSGYLRERGRGKEGIKPALMEKYEAELREAEAFVTEEAEKAAFTYRRSLDIALIEFPLLEQTVGREMAKKGIRYLFRTVQGRNLLTVHLAGPYFMDIPLSVENADRVLGLVRYFIHRPEYAREEMPEARTRVDRHLATVWNRVSSTGIAGEEES